MLAPQEILRQAKTIALVGASPKPWRASNEVMRYLLEQGYRVLPVRPLDCEHVLGLPCAASLRELEEPVDLVNVFRRAEHAPELAREAVAIGAKALWLQLGIVSAEARTIARAGGLDYVEDACTKVVHHHYLA
ncbi:MAG TPA: CoA-binding protein [Gaiellaceae bacterium]